MFPFYSYSTKKVQGVICQTYSKKLRCDILNIYFRKCSDVQRMFHELTDKVMDKAFIKAREHVQNSYSECKSNDAWIEEKQHNFMKCTQTLRISIPWLWEYLADIEHVAIQNTHSKLETQI